MHVRQRVRAHRRRAARVAATVAIALVAFTLNGCTGSAKSASAAQTTSVDPGHSFTVVLPGVASLSGPQNAVTSPGTVSLQRADGDYHAAGFVSVGAGVDVTFHGTAPAADLTLALTAPIRPAGATVLSPSAVAQLGSPGPSSSASGAAVLPVVIHRLNDGSYDLDVATVDAEGRFVIQTRSFSPHWPAWLDPRKYIGDLVHSVSNFITGRTNPGPCKNNGPPWAHLDKRTTLVHTCLITNKDAKGVDRAEAGLQSNRGFWTKVQMPSGADYTWTSDSDKLLAQMVAKKLNGQGAIMLAPNGRVTAGFYQPTLDTSATFTTFQDNHTVALSLLASVVAAVLPDERGGWAALYGVLACGPEIPRDPSDAGGLWNLFACFVTDALPQLMKPDIAFGAAKSLFGEGAYAKEAEPYLKNAASKLQMLGKFVKIAQLAFLVRDIWQQIPDAFAAMGSDHTGEVNLTLDPPVSKADLTAAGCTGCHISGRASFTHPTWGRVTLVVAMSDDGMGTRVSDLIVFNDQHRVVWRKDYQSGWDEGSVANPAMDSTGNLFVNFNPGRYNGVIILRPVPGGFKDFATLPDTDSGYAERFYSARLVYDSATNTYTVRSEINDCTPSCADGTIHVTLYHFNGQDYVPE